MHEAPVYEDGRVAIHRPSDVQTLTSFEKPTCRWLLQSDLPLLVMYQLCFL